MKKRLLACFLVAVMAFTLADFSNMSVQAAKTVKAKKITLSKKTYTVENGNKITLKATITPKNSTKKTITWKVGNKKVATITKKGVVSGKKVGTTSATATIKGTKLKTTCKIKVIKAKVKVASVSINTSTLSLTVGQDFSLVATVNPSNATNKSIIWTSSNTGIATVSKGKVKGISTGQAVITATSKDTGKASSCMVTVSNPAIGISLPITSSTLLVNQELLLTPSLTPANADNTGYIWSSTNPSVISVVDGVVKALSPGTGIILCTSGDKKQATQCAVTVPSTYGVLDIQGISDGDNFLVGFEYRQIASIGTINITGYDPTLSSNFAVKVADGVTYKIHTYNYDNYNSFKKIVLNYKNLTKIYYVAYRSVRTDGSYKNPIITSVSDGANILTFQSIFHKASDETIGTILLNGTNPILSSNFTLTLRAGYSIKSTTEDTDPTTSLAKTIVLTKDNIDYTYSVNYVQQSFKTAILAATDGTNTITELAYGTPSNSEIELTIYGTNLTLSAAFALTLEAGATYTLTDDPTFNYYKIATVSYGDFKTIYKIKYFQGGYS